MVIGIGGVSRAGKTTLAIKLKRRLKGKTINILNQDDFVKKTTLPIIHGHIDWEHPDSLDWKALRAAVRQSSLVFDLTIIEGLFAFYDRAINRRYDFAFFVHIQKELFFKRKRADMRWGKEPDWFIHHIWSSYHKFGQLPDSVKEVMWIEGNASTDIDQIVHYIR